MRLSITRAAIAALAITVALAVGASIVGISFALSAEHESSTALETYIPAASRLNQLLTSMVDQETGERGYVIAENPSFLQPYQSGRAASNGLIRTLRRRLSADPTAKADLILTVQRYNTWLHNFAMPQIADIQRHDPGAAIKAEQSGQGKALFDNLRRSLTRLDTLITHREHVETTHIRSLQEEFVWLVVALLACIIGGSLIGFALLNRWIIRPVQQLEQSVDSQRGVEPTPQRSAPTEIASLGARIGAMRQRLLRQGAQLGEHRQIVNVLQDALLPRHLPDFEGFAFASRYLPAATEAGVGGDWFNVRKAGPHRLFVAVGDVAGKGLQAAAQMASLRYAVNAYAAEDPDPGSVLTRIASLVDPAGSQRFATVLVCLLDSDEGLLHVASAGHLPPVIVSTSGSSAFTLKPGPPRGLGPHSYETSTLPLPDAATVLMFSDGLVERRDEPIDTGIARLANLAMPNIRLEEMLDSLLASDLPQREDDTVVCAFRIRPKASEDGVVRDASVPTTSTTTAMTKEPKQ